MSDTQLVVLSMADEEAAIDLVRQLDAIDKLDENVHIVDAAIAIKSGSDKVKLKQLKVAGSTKGGVMGAISGAIGGLASIFRDAGIDDDMMRRTALELEVGGLALFILYTGDWNRSSAVLQDALLAHGIRYLDQKAPASTVVTAQKSADVAPSAEDDYGFDVEIVDSEPEEVAAVAAIADEVVDTESEEETEPVFGDDSVYEEGFIEEADEGAAAVADASRAALMAAASDVTRAEDAEIYAEGVGALSETAGMAGAMDTRQGVAMLDASTQVGEAGMQMGLLSLERRYSGMEVGRIAGELAQTGKDVGKQDMPILSAILGTRSARLQEIAAELLASAATVRELASVLDAAGGQVGGLGANEVDEGATRLMVARQLAARAAEAGAVSLALRERAEEEWASAVDAG